MGLYLDTRKILIHTRDTSGSIAPGAIEDSAKYIKNLDSQSARNAVEFAIDSEFLDTPKEEGEFYVLNSKGKRYLRSFLLIPTGVLKKYSNDNPWLSGLFGGLLSSLLISLLNRVF